MKKLTTFAGFLALALTFVVADANVQANVDDGCDIGAGNEVVDIDTLTATYDDINDLIIVEMVLCGNLDGDKKKKYRVRFDHTTPFFDEEDRNDDGVVDGNDFCATTSDAAMMHRSNKDTGPGVITSDTDALIFTVPVDELNPALELGDLVYVWGATNYKNIQDGAPTTEGGDGCSKPEAETEVLALTLGPSCPGPGDPPPDPPVIISISVIYVTATTAEVIWITDVPATSQVEIIERLSGAVFLRPIPEDPILVTAHFVPITGLEPDKRHVARAISAICGVRSFSSSRAFATSPLP